MAQIFPSSMNTVARVTLIGGVLFLGLAGTGAMAFYRSPAVTNVNIAREQAVPFSHRHHVRGLGIDCRYCHTTVETSPYAGIPATETCMSCHSQVWTQAPMLEPVRQSWDTGQPLQWVRVNDLPDFVYFNHSIHVNKGIGCVTCHGQVDDMPLVSKANTFHMSWCLQCHKRPENFIRPKEHVFDMTWTPARDNTTQKELGPRLVEQYDINKAQLTNCSVCHR
ncbi:MAG: cytochrome c [Candidatus Hydrogenedentota bacterium]